MILVHYGSRKFNLKRFNKIQNTSWIKPLGGLWTCPIDANESSWKNWCESENFRTNYLKCRMILKLRSRKILVINSFSDLKRKFSWICDTSHFFKMYIPDFEKMSKKYDAIYLTEKGQARTRFSNPFSLYGWDCECVLILNGKKVKQISRLEYKKINH